MCLIVIAINRHPDYPLVIAANRDEFYRRPTAPLAFWDDYPEILGGRDLQAGGTWLGISLSGRIAALTNYRNPSNDKPYTRTRGEIITGFLTGAQSPEAYIHQIRVIGDQYNGFNLIAGDVGRLWWFSNVGSAGSKLDSGIYGICNHLLDTPWPKLEKAKRRFHDIVTGSREIEPEDFFHMLEDTEFPPDDRLPDTGVGLDWERLLSPIFVHSEVYGTRSSSLIFYHKSGLMTFIERTFKTPSPTPTPLETRRVDIQVKLN